jgi:fatty-acyl-CoA synthase
VTALSYAHGVSDTPLLGETIGANLARTVAEQGDRDALVVRHQGVRWSYASSTSGSTASRAA